jgi:RNA polymerase sigma-70 factor (ECF subfamily)
VNLENLGLAALSRRCLGSNDPDLWAELISRLQVVFARVAYRVASNRGCSSASEIDDIVQTICFKLGTRTSELLRLVPGDNDQSAIAYFKVLAANAARDYFRSKYAEKRGALQTAGGEFPLDVLAASLGSPRNVERQILIAEVDACLPEDPASRTIFWLYYRQGLTAKEIAAIPGVDLGAKGVESLVHRLVLAVRSRLRPEVQPTRSLPSKISISEIAKGEVTPEAS